MLKQWQDWNINRVGSVRGCQKVRLVRKTDFKWRQYRAKELDFILLVGQLRDINSLALYFRSMQCFINSPPKKPGHIYSLLK